MRSRSRKTRNQETMSEWHYASSLSLECITLIQLKTQAVLRGYSLIVPEVGIQHSRLSQLFIPRIVIPVPIQDSVRP